LETAGSNITCDTICPGWVLTPLVQKQIEDRAKQNGRTIDEEQRALVAEKHLSGQFVTTEDMLPRPLFLFAVQRPTKCADPNSSWTEAGLLSKRF
jgi:3-hydroxybutyrate dehydrogenase